MNLIQEGLWKAIKINDNNLTTLAKTTVFTSKATNSLTTTSVITNQMLNQQAVATIIFLLDNSLIDHIMRITLVKNIWETLKGLFSLQDNTTCYLLLKNLVITTLANLTSVKNFVYSLIHNKQRLHKMRSLVLNWILTIVFLHSFNNLYESFVSSTLQNV